MTKLDIVVAPGPWDPQPWRDAFQKQAGQRNVRVWPHDGERLGDAPYVICSWKAEPRVFEQAVEPSAVFSLGAGVDHLQPLADKPHIPVGRIVDPDLTMRMVEYVSFAVLYLHRKIRAYEASQSQRRWAPLVQPAASSVSVGIMGVGVLGSACARALQSMGFQVAGWARSKRTDTPFPVYAGPEELLQFLARTNILVSLLPSTPATRGLIDMSVFRALAHSDALGAPCFVNAGRGEAVSEQDLIEALNAEVLGGAVLDVFEHEPLPSDSPLWDFSNVLITPHVAADSDPEVVVGQIVRNVERLEAGRGIEQQVDLSRGY